MIKISDIVKDSLKKDINALISFQKGILNLSAFAGTIKKSVEEKLYKPVKLNTIVAALRRVELEEILEDPLSRLVPEVIVDEVTIKSGLAEVTLPISSILLNIIGKYKVENLNSREYFAITMGTREITIIASQKFVEDLENKIIQDNMKVIKNLAAVTVGLSEDYIREPNIIYTLVARLAARQINLMEIVSTYTELSFIVAEKDSRMVVDVLKENK